MIELAVGVSTGGKKWVHRKKGGWVMMGESLRLVDTRAGFVNAHHVASGGSSIIKERRRSVVDVLEQLAKVRRLQSILCEMIRSI